MGEDVAPAPGALVEFATPDQMTTRDGSVDLWEQLAVDLSSAGLFFTRAEREEKLAAWYLQRAWPVGRDPWAVGEFDDPARRTLAAWCWPAPSGAPADVREVFLRHIQDPEQRAMELRRRVAAVAANLQAAYARFGMDLAETLQPWMGLRDDPYWFARILDAEEPLVAEELLEASAVAGLSFSRGPLWGEPFQDSAPLRGSGVWVIDPAVRRRYIDKLQAAADLIPAVRKDLRKVVRGARPVWQDPDRLHHRHVAHVLPPKPEGKFRPLFEYLDRDRHLLVDEVRLTLGQVDALVGKRPAVGRGRRSAGLPEAARRPSWWANPGGQSSGQEAVKRRRAAAGPNGPRSHTAAWLAAGFTAHPEVRYEMGPGGARVVVTAVRFKPFEYRHSWYHERQRLRRADGEGAPVPPADPGQDQA